MFCVSWLPLFISFKDAVHVIGACSVTNYSVIIRMSNGTYKSKRKQERTEETNMFVEPPLQVLQHTNDRAH